MIYLDNAATTYPKPEEVYKALDKANRELAFNAGRGSYAEAKKVFDMITDTKDKLTDLVGLSADKVSFESSATEALNIIINGLDLKQGDTVYVSPFEHNAIVRPLYNLKDQVGINIEIIPFNKDTWEVEQDKLNDMFLLHNPKAVFLSHISNVTGYILPYELIFKMAKEYNCVNILDSSQSFGVLNPNVDNIDFVVFAGHKSLYASFGVAGFINVNNYLLRVTKSGGTGSDSLNHYMPESGSGRYEAGSANSVAIAGLNASLDWLKQTDVYEHEKEVTEYLIKKLTGIDNVNTYLPKNINNILGIVCFNVEGYHAADVGTILAEDFNICVRTGYHCSPEVHDFIDDKMYLGNVRISVGAFTSKTDIDELISALKGL